MGLDQKLKEFKQLYDLKGCYNVAGSAMLKRTTTPLIWLQDIYPAVSDMACIDFLDYLESSDAEAYRFERLKLDLMLAYKIIKQEAPKSYGEWRSDLPSHKIYEINKSLLHYFAVVENRGLVGKYEHAEGLLKYEYPFPSLEYSCFEYTISRGDWSIDKCFLVKALCLFHSINSNLPVTYKTTQLRFRDTYDVFLVDEKKLPNLKKRLGDNYYYRNNGYIESEFKKRTEKDKTDIYKNLNTQPSLVENILSNPGTWEDSFREVAKRHIKLYIQNGGFVCEASWNAIVKQLDLPTFTRIPEDNRMWIGNVLDGSDPLQRKMLRRKIKSNASEFMQCPMIKTPLLKLSLLSERRKSLAPY